MKTPKEFWSEIQKGFWLSLTVLNSINYFKYSIMEKDGSMQFFYWVTTILACILFYLNNDK